MTKQEVKDVRWQLDIPTKRAAELDAFMAEYGYQTRKDLVNTAISFLQWAVKEVKTGRIIASLDEKTSRYKQIDLPAFARAADEDIAAQQKPAVKVADVRADLRALAATLEESSEAQREIQVAFTALQRIEKLAA